MEKIFIVSEAKESGYRESIGSIEETLHLCLHQDCDGDCVNTIFLDGDDGSFFDRLDGYLDKGTGRAVFFPVLTEGERINDLIGKAMERFPGVEFRSSGSEDFLGIIRQLRNETLMPEEIEKRSFAILSEEAELNALSHEEQAVIKRVVHATADFGFIRNIALHRDAIEHGITMIREGKDILTDIEMVRTGVNGRTLKRFGGRVICGLSGLDAERYSVPGQTRSETAIELMFKENTNIGIVAVGNAPTALLKVIEILNRNGSDAAFPLVIGVPVGFVKALESKILLSLQRFPFITNISRKGGTPVAVAVVNALLKLADERGDKH